MKMAQDIQSDWKLTKVCPDMAWRWRNVRSALWESVGRQIRVTDGMRTFQEQMDIFSKGRTKSETGQWMITEPKLIVSHALPGSSLHNFGLALDSCFIGDDPYLEKLKPSESEILWELYGKEVEDQGMVWGGRWKGMKVDKPHCELTYGMSLHLIQMIYEAHGLGALWEKCRNALMCGGVIE